SDRLRAAEASVAKENGRLREELAALRRLAEEHARERDEHRSLETRHRALAERADELRLEGDALRSECARLEAAARERDRLAGALVAERNGVAALRAQLDRTEHYADGLRRQLRDRAAEAEANDAARRALADELAAARADLDGLQRQLEADRERRTALERERDEERRRFEEELAQLRSDLANAEQAITDNQAVNEQLSSDLLESSSFRAALEAQLAEAEESHERQVRELNRELKRLKQQVEESQRKLTSKDAAIGVLLAELAAKPEARPVQAGAEPWVQRTVDRPSPPPQDRPPAQDREKDRTARLLVGTLDGQEVRFPLFKNKL